MPQVDVSFLTRSLQTFIGIFGAGFQNLQADINTLLAILAVIELALVGLWWGLSGGEALVGVFKKLLYVTFWIWLVQQFPFLAKTLVTSLVSAGLKAGGGQVTVQQMLDPSALVGIGLDATEPLANKLGEMGSFDIADMIVFGVGYLAIMACFVIMAINLFLAVLEYYMFAGIVGILLPFGLLPSTKFIAEKAIGAVVSAGIKLMTLSFITSAVIPIIVAARFPGDDDQWNMNGLWASLLIMGGTTALCWKAPALAAGLMSGSPSLGFEHAFGLGQTAATASVGAAMGAVAIGTGNPGLAITSATRVAATVSGMTASSSGSSAAPPPVPAASATLVRSLAA